MNVRRHVTAFTVYVLILFAVNGIDLLPAHILSEKNALMIQYAVYCILIVLWAISAQNRIITQAVRRMHVALVFCFVFVLFLSRMMRIVFAGVYPHEHLMWYLCYIPNLALPLISFYMSLYVGKDDSFRLPPVAKLFVIPYVLLVLAVLTNEYHELAFKLEDRGQAIAIAGRYHVSFIYYITQLWMFGFAMLAILHLYYILQKNELRAYILPPVLLMGLGLAYTILYAFDRSPTGIGYIEANAMTVFSTMGLWEVCIIMRLIPSNSEYGSFFRACTVPMEIIDQRGEVCYESSGYEQTGTARDGDAGVPERRYLTRAFGIPGGSICWREDVTEIYGVIAQLEEGAKALAASNEKLDAQNRMRLRERKAAERARLYDEALLNTGDRLARMREILRKCEAAGGGAPQTDEERQDALALLCVLGAYVKRRSNLVMLSEHEEMLPLSELHFCIRESNEALVLVPVSTVYKNEADETVSLPAREIMRLYDAFQSAIEARLQGMEYLRMTLMSAENKVTLSLMCGGSGTGEETLTFSIPYGGQAA